MKEEEKIQLLDDYLHERLTARQLSEFQQMLASDPELKKELEIHEMLVKGIVLESKTGQFRKHLEELRKETPVVPLQEPADQKTRKMPVWSWAAGLAAMLLIGISYFWFTQSVSGDQLYAHYYEPYPASVLASVTRGDTLLTMQQRAVQAYENREYEKAIPLLEKTIRNEPKNTGWNLILGICYLEKNNAELAEQNFTKVVQKPDNLFYKQGQWYLALTYLKQNKTAQATTVLKDLAAQSGVYPQKARRLINEL